MTTIREAAAIMGRKGGKARNPKKTAALRKNWQRAVEAIKAKRAKNGTKP